MEENEMLGAEESTPMTDEQAEAAFESGWNDESEVSFETDQSEGDNGNAEPADNQGTPAGEDGPAAGDGDTDPAPEQNPAPPAQPERRPLKYMGETLNPSVEERDMLAQKGLDYDRIRGKLDGAQPVLDIFHQCALAENKSDGEFLHSLRTQLHMNRGLSAAEAQAAIEREDAAAAHREEERIANERYAVEQRRSRDLKEFSELFPDVAKNPEQIPDEVWAAVNGGKSLAFAYQSYALAQANAKLSVLEKQRETAAQNASNANRSTGSMGSAGASTNAKDPFLEGWDS